jgi:hypothetical protein
MASGNSIPETERLKRGQHHLNLRLPAESLTTLDDIGQGDETRQDTLRRLIREAATQLFTKPKRGKTRKAWAA